MWKHKFQVSIVPAKPGVAIGTVGLLTIAALAGVFCRKSRTTFDVERFLHDYVDERPRRYSYSQLKKITNNFTEKLNYVMTKFTKSKSCNLCN
ncbi:hypothetical protein SUGI_0117220 [Cryptomeria japonica]|nr:hypothetical protein SUGI_0117220 [Cryptomeria japonica]